ncbi:MAG: hypothetical protein NXH72_13730 [Hyphomonadaceae bacterium]|nr:hypothetical protein [Hyphomonadaceae bacterium]
MSRAKPVKYALPMVALMATVACATTDAEPQLTPEEQSYQAAIEAALQPATPEEIARAERSDPITRANFWAAEYQKDAANLDVTVKFMQSLRAIGSHERVIEIASAAIPIHPQGYELYLEMGRSFMAMNRPDEAARAFVRSADFSPETDATPLAALGVAFDRLEEHAQAQDAYTLALQREPNRASTLSNYGLSLALTGRLIEAETALRQAVAADETNPRIRQNLALILGLQGQFDEMMMVDPSAPVQSIEANQRTLREMMGLSTDFSELKSLDQVIDEVNRTPAAPQPMPGVREAQVSTESMDEPAREPELAGEQAPGQSNGLRPKLRGSTGR